MLDDEPGAGDADHPTTRPGAMSHVRRGAELVRLALGLDEDAAVSTGRDTDLDERVVPDEIGRREGLGAASAILCIGLRKIL